MEEDDTEDAAVVEEELSSFVEISSDVFFNPDSGDKEEFAAREAALEETELAAPPRPPVARAIELGLVGSPRACAVGTEKDV